MNITFFDSGAGGLTVLHEALNKVKGHHFIYYGDTLNAPYGTKSKELILELVLKAVDFLAQKNIDALVLACNTATSVAIKELRKRYNFPIIGMEPAIKLAVKNNHHKKILVSATELTLTEDKLSHLVSDLNAEDQVSYVSLQGLVNFAEKMEMDSLMVRKYIKEQFSTFQWDSIHSIVLGCTHFIYFKSIIEDIVPQRVQIIDGNQGTINQLIRCLPQTPLATKNVENTITFYQSGKTGYDDYFKPYLDFLKLR